MRALPNMLTAGRMPRSRSAAIWNSAIIPSTRHASCPLVEYSACGSISSGILWVCDRMATLVLVDGSSYLYRAFHALPDLRTSKGEPTGRAARRAVDVAPYGRRRQAGLLRRRVRRAGQDVSRRLVSRVQGESRRDARRSRAADRAAARARARARLAAADGRRRRGRRRHRHARARRRTRPASRRSSRRPTRISRNSSSPASRSSTR